MTSRPIIALSISALRFRILRIIVSESMQFYIASFVPTLRTMAESSFSVVFK